MSRKVRRVPAYWEHPKTGNGKFIPLLDRVEFEAILNEYEEGKAQWELGYKKVWDERGCHLEPLLDDEKMWAYEEYAGERPSEEDYMPYWTDEEMTHIQMYETTSEGTPISPVMANPEELAQWLTDNKVPFYGFETATYIEWLEIICATKEVRDV